MLQAHCLQSFAKQPIRIKDSSAVINALILLVERYCHHHTFTQHTVIHPFEIAHRTTQTHTHTRTSRVLSRLSAGNKVHISGHLPNYLKPTYLIPTFGHFDFGQFMVMLNLPTYLLKFGHLN